ncbi:MAG: OprO/OprP family phosphate-selective porin [Holophagaceae bacterium]|nr:OprO/OprP family phosphate-selective porin [Holophagaceae bacterium]
MRMRCLLPFLCGPVLAAQEVTLGLVAEAWYSQVLDSNLRLNQAARPAGAAVYYDGLNSGRFAENGFSVKRAEVYLSGQVTDTLGWAAMFDPNAAAAGPGTSLLADALVTWTPIPGFSLKAGQTKMPTAYEGSLVGSKDLLFFDRGQLNRLLGEVRDRCLWLMYTLRPAKGGQVRFNLALSNGTSDDGSKGRNNDLNAQKDWTFRIDGDWGRAHRWGVYYREGATSLKDSNLTAAPPATWTVGAPTREQVLQNRDRTTLAGLFYAYDDPVWHGDVELATGLLGRRFPMLFAAGSASAAPLREHLHQRYAACVLSGAWKQGPHWFTARYDFMDYNAGRDWYTATNPYTTDPATGLPTGRDHTPRYTEITVGYNHLFLPGRPAAGKLKIDYIHRSRNFLVPRPGQSGEQGGDSLVVSLMVGY